MEKRGINPKEGDPIQTPTSTATSKRKQHHDESDDISSDNVNARQVKKIRLIVSTKKDNPDVQENEPTSVSPIALQQRTQENLERDYPNEDDNEEPSSQTEVKESKHATPDFDETKEHSNIESLADNSQLSFQQDTETTDSKKSNIFDDISELFASPTPIEFISPPEPLFSGLDLTYSPSSTDLIDALLQTVNDYKDDLQPFSTDAASSITTHNTDISGETDQLFSQVVTTTELSADTHTFLETSQQVETSTETVLSSAGTEVRIHTDDNKQNQISKKRQQPHDDENDLSTARSEPIQERKVKKMKTALQDTSSSASSSSEPPTSKPSSSKPSSPKLSLSKPSSSEPSPSSTVKQIKDSDTKENPVFERSQPSTSTSRKGKERATSITEEKPATGSDDEQQEHTLFDKSHYEKIILQQELQRHSQTDEESYLSEQQSLLEYYKNISRGTKNNDSPPPESPKEESGTEKKKNDSKEIDSEQNELSGESPHTTTTSNPSSSTAPLDQVGEPHNTSDKPSVKSPPSKSPTLPDETSTSETITEPSSLLESTASPKDEADTPAVVLTSPNGTDSNVALPSTPIEKNDEAPQAPLPPFKNLAIRKTTPDGQRSYITEYICITNNDIQPVSIASTNNEIINRNEVPVPESFTVQTLKSPPRAKLRFTVKKPVPTVEEEKVPVKPTIEDKKAPIRSTMSNTSSRGKVVKRKQLEPSSKQIEINMRKERERLKPIPKVYNRGTGRESSQRTPSSVPGFKSSTPSRGASSSTAQSNMTARDSASSATTQSATTTEDTPSGETAQRDSSASTTPPAAGQQRDPKDKKRKIITLDDILKNMHR
ncbi:unnamed protein product [Mucor hiemalis]